MKAAFERLARVACTGLGLALVGAALVGSAHAKGPITATPEIDPGSMGSALTLLIGGAFLLTGRSRKS
jgi:hypothetical protein